MKEEKWGEAVIPGLIVVYMIAYLVQTYDLPYDAILYPFLLLGLLTVLLGVFAVQQWMLRRDAPPDAAAADDATPAQPVGAILSGFLRNNSKAIGVVVFTFLFPQVVAHLGFFFTAALYLSALFWLFGTLRGVLIVPVALALSLFLTWLLLEVVVLNFPRFHYAELPWYL